MKLFYLPDTKAIVAKYNNKFVSLPNAIEIDKPAKLIPCQPFLKESKPLNGMTFQMTLMHSTLILTSIMT